MNIKPKEQSREKTKRKPPKKITETYLHNSGLYYLQRFAASSGQFRTVMMRKVRKSCAHHKEQDEMACAGMVDALIAKFQQSGLLNDDVYTSGSVNSLRRQGKSKKAIEGKLMTKGVGLDLIQDKLNDYDRQKNADAKETELQAALTHARKKKLGPWRTKPISSPEKELAAMARAGFSYETARKALAHQDDSDFI